MSHCWRLLLLLMLCVRQETELSVAVRRFVYHKDMSEYCRRRVMPSVFVGRQVVEANSQILHFSRMELPYSCFISVRTESGSNIILVIQLMTDKSLVQSCKESGSQLAVYELGETFGGYWGPLPDILMKQQPPAAVQYYTVKTTQMPSINKNLPLKMSNADSNEDISVESEKPVSNISKESTPRWDMPGEAGDDGGDFISIELPIVNVSAELVPGQTQSNSMFNIDESFDIMYDVTPGVGMEYQSSVMPLVQFSIDNVVAGERRRGGGVQWSPRFGVDYEDGFTLDSRLNFLLGSSTSKRKQHPYNKNNINRRLTFKKNKQLFAAKQISSRKKHPSPTRRAQYTIQPYNMFTRHYDFVQPSKPEKMVEPVPNSWEVIEDILKNLSRTKDVSTERPIKNDSKFLHRISEMEHNISAYLAPNLSAYEKKPTSSPQPVTNYSIGPITWRLPSVTYGSNILEQLDDRKTGDALSSDATESRHSVSAIQHTSGGEESAGTQGFSLDVDHIILKAANMSIADVTTIRTTNLATGPSNATTPKSSDLLTGSLVDHESWENIVQSAPVMAVLLNQKAPQKNVTMGSANGQSQTTDLPISSDVRKKRYIYAIPIENARPRKLPTVRERSATTASAYEISDAQEFAELIELQDNELNGRAALRYLRQYVGPVLFNICDYDETTARHVYVFNSSRLVLAINNFTMERMTVVVTPARSLLSSDARCGSAHLECQISGARVCIDSLSACDGIPNCGSYDVYDEDRLMCGAAAGLQHNVCLAAVTFLAVLLTILYTVHYWLKRCVPKVSDAFFIYTDAAENVLYLDSIMRPPHEIDDSKPFYSTNIFQEEMEFKDADQNQKGKICFQKYITKCFNFLRCKRKKEVSREYIMGEIYKMLPETQRLFSFPDAEIDKIMRKNLIETGVQTGSSVEMNVRTKASAPKFPTDIYHVNEKPGTSKDYGPSPETKPLKNPYNDELSILNFFRQARSVSSAFTDYKVSSPPQNVPQISQETELQCLDLEHSDRSIILSPVEQLKTTGDVHAEKAELAHYVQKRLRFEEDTTIIPSTSANKTLAAGEDKDDIPQRRSIMLGASRTHRSQDLDAIEECEGQRGSREYKSYFWGGSKSKKKSKKKSHVSLH